MVTVLESHLSLLEQEVSTEASPPAAGRLAALEELIILHLAVFEAIDRHFGSDGLKEAHRPLVPLVTRWLGTARQLADSARVFGAAGHEVAGVDLLLRTMNRSKLVAEDFDYFVSLYERLDRGETGSYRRLAAVMDERRRCEQPVG